VQGFCLFSINTHECVQVGNALEQEPRRYNNAGAIIEEQLPRRQVILSYLLRVASPLNFGFKTTSTAFFCHTFSLFYWII
jgi:hypothetical protein